MITDQALIDGGPDEEEIVHRLNAADLNYSALTKSSVSLIIVAVVLGAIRK